MWLSRRGELNAAMSKANPRKRVQFSLKTLLVLTLIVAAYFAGRIPAERRTSEMEMRAKELEVRAETQALKAEMMAQKARIEAEVARAMYEKQLQQIKSMKPPTDRSAREPN